MKHCGSQQPPHQASIANVTWHLTSVPQKTRKSWTFMLGLDITWCLGIDKYLHRANIKISFLQLVPIAICKASLSVQMQQIWHEDRKHQLLSTLVLLTEICDEEFVMFSSSLQHRLPFKFQFRLSFKGKSWVLLSFLVEAHCQEYCPILR